MANHKSAAKRARQAVTRRTRNSGVRTQVKKSVRKFREAADAKDGTATEAALKTAAQQLRRAASKGVLHKRTASRRVSRLTRACARVKGQ